MVRELLGNVLELDMLGVECTGSPGGEAGANRLNAFDGATELQALDSNRCEGAVSRGENGPHAGTQCVDRALKLLEPSWCRRGAGETGVDLLEQTAKRDQLLDQRLVGHTESQLKKGPPARPHQLPLAGDAKPDSPNGELDALARRPMTYRASASAPAQHRE
jgi:hypothetical protein